jgi:hypothetical protein
LLASRCTCGQRPATCGLSISALLAALEPKIGGSCATVGDADADADADAEFWRCEKQLLVCVRLLYLLLQNYCYIPPLALPPFAGATCCLAAVLVCCPPTDLLFSIRIRHCASRQKRLCAVQLTESPSLLLLVTTFGWSPTVISQQENWGWPFLQSAALAEPRICTCICICILRLLRLQIPHPNPNGLLSRKHAFSRASPENNTGLL